MNRIALGALVFIALYTVLGGLVGLFGWIGIWELVAIAAVAAVLTWLIMSRWTPGRAGP